MVKEPTYYRDKLGNIYVGVDMGEAFLGSGEQGADFGISSGSFSLDNEINEMIFNASPAIIATAKVSSESTSTIFFDTYKIPLGKGERTSTEYVGLYRSALIGYPETPGYFEYYVTNENENTNVKSTSTSQVFYFGDYKADFKLVRVAAIGRDKEIRALLIGYLYRAVIGGTNIQWGGYSTGNGTIRAGYTEYDGTNVRCVTNDEVILFDSNLTEVNEDSTPDVTPGGGFGDGVNPSDNIEIPQLPNINLNVTGSSMYSLTESQMQQFSKWLWTSDWTENIKKLRTDPMQNVVSISVVDLPLGGVDTPIVLGNVTTDITAKLTPRFVAVDCGEINCNEYYGTYGDYEPYVDFTLYLPKIGFIEIPADVVVNNTIHIVYHIELSSGEGICYVLIKNSRYGINYIYNTYTCSCCTNISLSASDHTGQIQASINAVTSLTNAALSGNAYGAASAAASGAANVATAKNPTVTKGALGNVSSLMSHKKPYITINATNLIKSEGFKRNNGHAIYFTTKISNLKGFIQTQDFKAQFEAPKSILEEIENLMDGGVFIDE